MPGHVFSAGRTDGLKVQDGVLGADDEVLDDISVEGLLVAQDVGQIACATVFTGPLLSGVIERMWIRRRMTLFTNCS